MYVKCKTTVKHRCSDSIGPRIDIHDNRKIAQVLVALGTLPPEGNVCT